MGEWEGKGVREDGVVVFQAKWPLKGKMVLLWVWKDEPFPCLGHLVIEQTCAELCPRLGRHCPKKPQPGAKADMWQTAVQVSWGPD